MPNISSSVSHTRPLQLVLLTKFIIRTVSVGASKLSGSRDPLVKTANGDADASWKGKVGFS